jgi:sulfate/thiosulfate transport system permease protein
VLNAVFGLLVAWVLVRYRIPGQALHRCAGRPALRPADRRGRHRADRAVLGTAGSASAGAAGIKVAFTPLGVIVALVFIGLPFVVRTVSRC